MELAQFLAQASSSRHSPQCFPLCGTDSDVVSQRSVLCLRQMELEQQLQALSRVTIKLSCSHLVQMALDARSTPVVVLFLQVCLLAFLFDLLIGLFMCLMDVYDICACECVCVCVCVAPTVWQVGLLRADRSHLR